MASTKYIDCVGYGTTGADKPLTRLEYKIPAPLDDEVVIKVAYCGLCHSDIHKTRDEWGGSEYPMIPGHEMVGYVDKIGSSVSTVKVGDIVGIGCMCDCCKKCEQCEKGEEQHCHKMVLTYDSKVPGDRHIWTTTGGYGNYVLCNARLIFPIPKELPLDKVAPLFCAGITTYNPVVTHQMDRGNLKIGVIGVGGLGHMAVQFAAKINSTNQVYGISRSKAKEALAKELGAKGVISSASADDMKANAESFDYLIDTISSKHDYVECLGLLKPRGTLILVGCPAENISIPPIKLLMGAKQIAGSVIGGCKLTKEMLEFCAKHNVLPMVEQIPLSKVNEAYERMLKSDVQFRFVVNVEKDLA